MRNGGMSNVHSQSVSGLRQKDVCVLPGRANTHFLYERGQSMQWSLEILCYVKYTTQGSFTFNQISIFFCFCYKKRIIHNMIVWFDSHSPHRSSPSSAWVHRHHYGGKEVGLMNCWINPLSNSTSWNGGFRYVRSTVSRWLRQKLWGLP